MKSLEIDGIIENYTDFFARELEISATEMGYHLMTPFVRPDGEGISLELATLPNGDTCFTDMGDSIGYLFVNGITLNSSVIAGIRGIALKYGVSFDGSSLSVTCDSDDTGYAVHKLIQAALAVSSLAYSRQPDTRKSFRHDVELFLINIAIPYDVDYKVKGERKTHQFKFHVNAERNLLVQPLSAATEATAQSLAEKWVSRFSDVVAHNEVWHPVAILDDRKDRRDVWTERVLSVFRGNAILWAQKELLAEMLNV